MRCILVAVLCTAAVNAVVVNHRQRFPGPYCLTRRPEQCCPGRDDTCTVPIKDTVCYCDQFCAIHNHEDCCPDFDEVCLNKTVTTPSSQPQNECVQGGRLFQVGQTVKVGCNQCRCVLNVGRNVQTWECGDEACINDQGVVDRVNSGRYGWTANTYVKFDGETVADGLRYYLGTTRPRSEVVRLNPLQIDPDEQFDRYFDAREKWPNAYIHPAMDQGRCASSWAFSTGTVAADRWAIQSQGKFVDQMAVQSIISCNRFIDGCNGASVVDAWYYLQKEGAVAEECYPYTSGTTREKGVCKEIYELVNCVDDHVHMTTPPYRIATDERQIMKEIRDNGPVQAIITVHPDFYLYERGIYRHSREERNDSQTGTHSVKIIGWGEENGVKYWRCVNSWGQKWGEDGMFRIRRGENESGIEDFIVGVWARVEKHDLYDTKRRRHRRH